MNVYGITNCDTVKEARAWLAQRGVSHRFVDFKKMPPTRDQLAAWCAAAGWQTLLNRRGTTWKKLEPEAQARVIDAHVGDRRHGRQSDGDPATGGGIRRGHPGRLRSAASGTGRSRRDASPPQAQLRAARGALNRWPTPSVRSSGASSASSSAGLPAASPAGRLLGARSRWRAPARRRRRSSAWSSRPPSGSASRSLLRSARHRPVKRRRSSPRSPTRCLPRYDGGSPLAPITDWHAGFDVAARVRRAARDRAAARRARLAAGRPQDRLHQPHDLAALRRVPADVGARVARDGRCTRPTAAPRFRSRAPPSRASSPRSCSDLCGPVPVTDDARDVLRAVDWIAPGFEIVQSHFPGWKFKAPDCTAAFGLHAALVVGHAARR